MPPATPPDNSNLLQRFFDSVQKKKDAPLVWEKRRNIYQSLSWKEVASRSNLLVRSLSSLGLQKNDRIANLLPNDSTCLITDLASMTIGSVSVLLPDDFSQEEKLAAMIECQAKILFCADDALIRFMLSKEEQLSNLECIVVPDTVTVKQASRVKVTTWSTLLENGRSEPDKFFQLLKNVQARDAVNIIYTRDDEDVLHAVKRNHKEISALCNYVLKLAGLAQLTHQDTFLVTAPHCHMIGHYAGHILPILLEAQIYYADANKISDIDIFNISPSVILGESPFVDNLMHFTIQQTRGGGTFDSVALDKAMALGKAKYENPKGLTLIQRTLVSFLKTVVINRIRRQLGGKLHAILTVDDRIRYDTQLFFYSFGIDLIEITEVK